MSEPLCTKCKQAPRAAGKYVCSGCHAKSQTESRARNQQLIRELEEATAQPVTLIRKKIIRQLGGSAGAVLISQYYENGKLVAEGQPEKGKSNG